MVTAQQEHKGIVRKGMATHERLLRTAVATEKKKATMFEKLLYRTGVIYSSMIAAGTMPPPASKWFYHLLTVGRGKSTISIPSSLHCVD